MYELKGFYQYPSFIDNTTDKVAMFGEISDNSLTYAKNKSIHTGSSTPNVGIISFHSVRDDIPVQVAGDYLDQGMKLGQYLFTQAVAGVITNNATALRQMVMAEFAGKIESFSSGPMRNNGTVWMPEYVEYKLVGAENNRNIFWLSDSAFGAQYDGYIIEVIQPLLPVDDFFKDPLIVKQLLDSYNMVDKLTAAQAAREQYPYTHLRAFEFDYVNPVNTTQRFPAKWIVLVYGEAGNNPDLIKDAIVKDLLEKSTRPRTDWEVILPDLFLTTEFLFVPLWNKYSVPNADFQAGIYSPIADPNTDIALILKAIKGPGYNATYNRANYQTGVNIYKSLSFAVIGNPQNRGGIRKLTAKYPQYLVAEVGSGDANRVDPETLEWMGVFSKLLVAAESMTRYTSVPQGLSRMVRDNVVYASAFFKNVNYLVAAKESVMSLT